MKTQTEIPDELYRNPFEGSRPMTGCIVATIIGAIISIGLVILIVNLF